MAKNQYAPGSRNPQFRFDGKMSANRITWLRTILGTLVIMFYPTGADDEDNPEEDKEKSGPAVRLVIPRPYGKPTTMNLSALTGEELKLMREFFNLLFDLAEPLVREKDKVAQDAYDNGDDSFARVYRQVPQLVIREGPLGDDYESLRQRLEETTRRVGSKRRSNGGLRGGVDELVAGEPEESRTQDDGSETDQP